MSDSTKKPPPSNDRRRVSRIVHDERGNARVEWIEVEDSRQNLIDRRPLEIEDDTSASRAGKTPALAIERAKPKGFDPYQRVATAGRTNTEPKRAPAKRDLRKLGEWIKLKRELEERRARGELDEED
jgi:hypothetical protein